MTRLFDVLAGQSKDTFKLGGVEFMAAPLTIVEYSVYENLHTERDAQAEFWAEKLRMRLVSGAKVDPATITPDWYMENVPMSLVNTLAHVLIHGEMPTKGGADEKKTDP